MTATPATRFQPYILASAPALHLPSHDYVDTFVPCRAVVKGPTAPFEMPSPGPRHCGAEPYALALAQWMSTELRGNQGTRTLGPIVLRFSRSS